MSIRADIFDSPEERKAHLLVRKKPKQADSHALTDLSVKREEHRRADMRAEQRPAVEAGRFKVRFRERIHEVTLINLSGGGAMIEATLKPNICERMDLHLANDETMECVVRWVKNGRLGLEFAHETQLKCPAETQTAVLSRAVSRLADEIEMIPVAVQSGEGRTSERHPLIWLGELKYRHHRCTVRLRNISATGALVQCSRPLKIGAEVVLDLGMAGEVHASISWVVGDHAGLHFLVPYDLEQLSLSKPRVTPPTWLRPSYLESEASADSAWDGPWNRMSLNELRSQLEGFLKR